MKSNINIVVGVSLSEHTKFYKIFHNENTKIVNEFTHITKSRWYEWISRKFILHKSFFIILN